MTSKTTKLPAESTVAVSNARRGWYRIFPVILGEKWDPAVAETSLAAGDTLVLLEILIPGEDIEEQDLQRLCDVFSFFVQKKLDLILRFSYDFEGKGREKDPSSLSVVERHMRQIFPVLNEFADHIFVLQGIFLGGRDAFLPVSHKRKHTKIGKRDKRKFVSEYFPQCTKTGALAYALHR